MKRRTPTKATGGITEVEREKMKELTKKWTANALKTGRCDKEKITKAIKELYKVSGLKEPRVVIVPSPFVMACAYGLAAGWWYLRKNSKLDEATDDATREATKEATLEATDDATDVATEAATIEATREATNDATYSATLEATLEATIEATLEATYSATIEATYSATIEATYSATRRATDDATRRATREATLEATREATDVATLEATREATYSATREATDAETRRATREATLEATYSATIEATNISTREATDLATYISTREAWLLSLAQEIAGNNYQLLLDCVTRWSNVYQGGNMWSAFLCYADAMKNILGLTGLDCWDDFEPYMEAGIHGGFRVMHEEFCIVSDFPDIIKIDDQNRPHCEDGPSHKWSDGFSIYYINGVRVNRQIVEFPETITIKQIQEEKNQEVRRIMIERFGVGRYLTETDSKVIDMDCRTNEGAAPRVLIQDCNNNKWLVVTDGSTERVYHLFVEQNIKTCRKAHESVCGFNEDLILIES